MLNFLLLLFLAIPSQADIPLGALAGGELKARHKENRIDPGTSEGSFVVEWKSGKKRRSVTLYEYSSIDAWDDTYSLLSAKHDGNKITVVIERQGAYDYRGNDRTTYSFTFDPDRLQFSKPKESVESDLDLSKAKLRKFFSKACDPWVAPSRELIGETVTTNSREVDLLDTESAYSLLFEAVHACALEKFKKGDQAGARALVQKSLAPLEEKKDWICQVRKENGDDEPCPTRKRIFFETFLPSHLRLANDMGYFLAGDPTTNPLAKEVLAAVVSANKTRAVARLNYADVLWDLGEKEKAKEQYQEYLKRVEGKSKNVGAERARVREKLLSH